MNFKVQINQKIIKTKKIRKLVGTCRSIDWATNPTVTLKVIYGKFIDNFGKLTTFYNEGVYTDKETFQVALAAFLEDEYKISFSDTAPYIKFKTILVPEFNGKKSSK